MADPHHADPLAHLQVTVSAFPKLYKALHDLAFDAAGGRWAALGGGGYTFDLLPRAWTLLFAEMVGADLPDEIPAAWLEEAERRAGEPLTRHLREDREPTAPADQRARADEEGNRIVDQARAMVASA